MQLDYSGKPSIIFKLKEGVTEFMNKANGDTASNKEALERLASDYSMCFIDTDTYDEDCVGFERCPFHISNLLPSAT